MYRDPSSMNGWDCPPESDRHSHTGTADRGRSETRDIHVWFTPELCPRAAFSLKAVVNKVQELPIVVGAVRRCLPTTPGQTTAGEPGKPGRADPRQPLNQEQDGTASAKGPTVHRPSCQCPKTNDAFDRSECQSARTNLDRSRHNGTPQRMMADHLGADSNEVHIGSQGA